MERKESKASARLRAKHAYEAETRFEASASVSVSPCIRTLLLLFLECDLLRVWVLPVQFSEDAFEGRQDGLILDLSGEHRWSERVVTCARGGCAANSMGVRVGKVRDVVCGCGFG